jgi:hypothetical protein
MHASIDDGPDLRAGKPEPVPGAPGNLASVGVARDGRLLLLSVNPSTPTPLTFVQNWMRLVEQP